MIKYNGMVKANPLKIEKEQKELLIQKKILENKIKIALGSGFDTTSYEDELKNVTAKINIYKKII